MSRERETVPAATPPTLWSLLVVVIILGAWEGAARLAIVSPIFFPPPSAIALTLAHDAQDGQLLPHLSSTVLRTAPALLLGGVPAVIVGLLLGSSARLRAMTEPVIAALHPIPKLALLPLFIVILGVGEAPTVLVAAVAAFFPLAINSLAGVRQISRVHFEVARSYGASPGRILARVVLPGSLPMILAGLRLSANIALVTVIAVEMISAEVGLGARVWLSWQVLRTEQLYATLFVIAFLGIALNAAVQLLERHLVPWRDA